MNAYRRDHADELPGQRTDVPNWHGCVQRSGELKAEREFLGKAAAFFAKEFR